MTKLCSKCGREFVPRSRLISRQRYGKSMTEIEIYDSVCDDCKKDSTGYIEGLEMEEE